MPRTQLTIVRHGETVWNIQGREMGQLDSQLTARGLSQARALANRLMKIPFSNIYSSDLQRAAKTAEIISQHTEVPVHFEPRLRERHMGIFQGLTVAEMREMHPTEAAEYEKQKADYVIPNGESAQQRLERTIACLNEIGNKHYGKRVLCVTHGGILMGFLQFVLGLDPSSERRFKRPNAAINVFEFRNGEWSLETWGDISHIEELGSLDDPPAQDI